MRERFRDRSDGGRRLAAALLERPGAGVRVLALPRGGVPVAYEVARALGAPLDVFVVRKLGVPGQEELALGAIASGGTRVLNREVLDVFDLSAAVVDAITTREQRELDRRERLYRGARALGPVAGQVVILVDDGVATGATMLAAVRALRAQGAARIVAAAPVASRSVAQLLREEADEVVCVVETDRLNGISLWYDDFEQTTDVEVRALLSSAATTTQAGADTDGEAGSREVVEFEVAVDAGGVRLIGDLALPATRRGLVIFAHGSGSGRRSLRNRQVAAGLQRAGLATLLVDLLTAAEDTADERTRRLRFDMPRLAERLVGITDWASSEARLEGLGVGLFGASTGAAAALITAARRPARVAAVVSRGGRPDLARDSLAGVRCPTLLIVGSEDPEVLALNRAALAALPGVGQLEVVTGATHLFEEPGALDRVAGMARTWFLRHVRPPDGGRARGESGTRGEEGV